ncbi:MAG: hypothetical protein K8R21_08445 [Leptospira sp.]|nr:hypothetical protein [Leptospira sp.]
MEYTIEVKQTEGKRYVHALISGELSAVARDAITREAVAIMREEKVPNFLWDIRNATMLYPLIESHNVVQKGPAFGITNSDRVAVVFKNNMEQHEHAATVAFNRGLNVKYFKIDIEKAIQWLLSR